jgi:hypothetical protein
MFDVKVRTLFVQYFNGRYLTFHKIFDFKLGPDLGRCKNIRHAVQIRHGFLHVGDSANQSVYHGEI